jgi:hypothetical protein
MNTSGSIVEQGVVVRSHVKYAVTRTSGPMRLLKAYP